VDEDRALTKRPPGGPPVPERPACRLRRTLRDFFPLILVIVLLVAGCGGWRVYRNLSDVHLASLQTFAGLHDAVGSQTGDVGRLLARWRPDVGGYSKLENLGWRLSDVSLLVSLLRRAGDAARVRYEPFESHITELHDTLQAVGMTLSRMSQRVRCLKTTEVDLDFIEALCSRLEALWLALKVAGRGDWPDGPADVGELWKRVMTETASLDELSWAYSYEAATVKGTRVAAVTSAEAETIARAHVGEDAGSLQAKTSEILNWWAGLHYWQVALSEPGGEWRHFVQVDAASGAVLGWSDLTDWDRPMLIPVEQAEAAAGAYLAAQFPGDHLLAGYTESEYTGSWLFTWFPRAERLIRFSDPITVSVSWANGEVVGYWRFLYSNARPPTGDPAQPLSEVARAFLGEYLGGPPDVEEECWATYRLGGGDAVPAWAVIARTSEEYRQPREDKVVHRSDGSTRYAAAPTHVVAFVEPDTGSLLGTVRLWLSGDADFAASYGSVRSYDASKSP